MYFIFRTRTTAGHRTSETLYDPRPSNRGSHTQFPPAQIIDVAYPFYSTQKGRARQLVKESTCMGLGGHRRIVATGLRCEHARRGCISVFIHRAMLIHCRQFPIVALVRAPYGSEDETSLDLTAHDTRRSSGHPLRHAVMNVIRSLSDYRSASPPAAQRPALASDVCPSPNAIEARNGNNYLLTSMTLFVTHEPCIMCSMALLHSRVKEVIYLVPMEKTGGCGSIACLPRLDGVNHRFSICQWKKDAIDVGVLEIGSHLDA